MNFKNNMWFVYAIAAGILWGAWGIVAKFISEDVNPFMNHFLFSIGMVLTLPFVIRKCERSEFNVKGMVWGCIAASFAVAGNVAVFYAFTKGGHASIVIPVTNLYPLITILIAFVAFKEKMNLVNVLGIIVSIPAIIMLSGETMLFTDTHLFFKSIGLNAWFLFSIAALFCWGLFSAAQKVTTNHISAEWSYAVFILTSVAIAIVFLATEKIEFTFSSDTFVLGTLAGIFNGLGVLASFSAYRAEGKASAVTTVAGTLQPVFTIVLALLILNERFSLVEFFAILLAISGSLLLSYEKKPKHECLTLTSRSNSLNSNV